RHAIERLPLRLEVLERPEDELMVTAVERFLGEDVRDLRPHTALHFRARRQHQAAQHSLLGLDRGRRLAKVLDAAFVVSLELGAEVHQAASCCSAPCFGGVSVTTASGLRMNGSRFAASSSSTSVPTENVTFVVPPSCGVILKFLTSPSAKNSSSSDSGLQI